MLRSRLLWFSMGFSVSAATIGHFVFRDLWADRYALSSHVNQTLDTLETRLNNLESMSDHNSNSTQVEG
ncbi:hypothetical protein M5689_018469 [Euphorbia peplus]|nr:hypothetical protein M5689_018469 [Euphorbia peplus]